MPPLETVAGFEEGESLLRATDGLAHATVVGGGIEQQVALMIAAFVLRARRLVCAIGRLIEADLEIEAEILNRALLEHAGTLAWICADPIPRLKRWRLHDARERLRWDDRAEKESRPVGGPEGSGERLLEPKSREELARLVEDFEAERVKGMPKAEQIFRDVGSPELYYLVYSYWSMSNEHPRVLAMEHFIVDGNPRSGWTLDGEAAGSIIPEPYETAVMNFHWALSAAHAVSPRVFPWGDELEATQSSLQARNA